MMEDNESLKLIYQQGVRAGVQSEKDRVAEQERSMRESRDRLEWTAAERAGRRVAEEIERRVLYGQETDYTYGGNTPTLPSWMPPPPTDTPPRE